MAANEHATAEFAIRAPLGRSDLPGLATRFCRLLAMAHPAVVFCDVSAVPGVDAVTVDALARMQLAARRNGCQVRLVRASPELLELVRWMGLQDVVRA
jgi:ABC-type transporter Mla MlaB component